MIKSIVLCEGETDQALIGGYLEKVAGWKYTKNLDSRLNPLPKESIWWYLDADDYYAGIWQIGGNNFSKAVRLLFGREKLEHLFNNVVIISDHDDKDAEQERLKSIQNDIRTALDDCVTDLQLRDNEWSTISFRDSFNSIDIQFLYLLIPVNEFGALETYMMNALAEQSEEKEHVINESRTFIGGFRSDVYLKRRRERIKAELGVSLSIFSPDRVFTPMKKLIDSVQWEEFTETHKQFNLLSKLF